MIVGDSRVEVEMGSVEDSVEWLGMGDLRFCLVRDSAIVRRMKRTDELVCGNGVMLVRVGVGKEGMGFRVAG